jgi:hypothetical protein
MISRGARVIIVIIFNPRNIKPLYKQHFEMRNLIFKQRFLLKINLNLQRQKILSNTTALNTISPSI